jgi:chloramphenicol O-acetyltransferase
MLEVTWRVVQQAIQETLVTVVVYSYLKTQELNFMAYFIFQKNLDNIPGTIYRIAENQSDLNNLNIEQSSYKIIEDSQENFNSVKYGTKNILKYNENSIVYQDQTTSHSKESLLNYIKNTKDTISIFLNSNINHSLYPRWNNYHSQLTNLNLDSITYPLNKSIEQYFTDLGQPSFHILQLP